MDINLESNSDKSILQSVEHKPKHFLCTVTGEGPNADHKRTFVLHVFKSLHVTFEWMDDSSPVKNNTETVSLYNLEGDIVELV